MTAGTLATLIRERLLGVRPDDQDLVLEDGDWELVINALEMSERVADLTRRDLLNSLLALNPEVARKLHDCRAEGEPFNNPHGKLPFDVVFWVTEVAERLGIEPREDAA